MSKKKRRDGSAGRAAKAPTKLSGQRARAVAKLAPNSVSEDAAWHAVRSPLRLQVLEAIRAAPGIDARALSKALKTSAPRLYYHINILLGSGLIVGVDGNDPGARRSSVRGPEAIVYRANSRDFDDGFFSDGSNSRDRHKELLRELFDSGIGFAIASETSESTHVSARREHLTPAEAAKVRALLKQVDEVLDGARTRRHGESNLVHATHFIGTALCELDGSELPDGPLKRA